MLRCPFLEVAVVALVSVTVALASSICGVSIANVWDPSVSIIASNPALLRLIPPVLMGVYDAQVLIAPNVFVIIRRGEPGPVGSVELRERDDVVAVVEVFKPGVGSVLQAIMGGLRGHWGIRRSLRISTTC